MIVIIQSTNIGRDHNWLVLPEKLQGHLLEIEDAQCRLEALLPKAADATEGESH